MKALLINGSLNERGCTYTALHEVELTLQRHGIQTELLYLGKRLVAGCIACMKYFETGHCFRDDAVKDIQTRLDEFDAIILGFPVYYSGPTGQIMSFCQRLFFCKERKTTGKLGASVVSCRHGGASATFEQLNQFFTISNMPVVSSQYWNSVHGFTPDDVRRDAEGLQAMRIHAQTQIGVAHFLGGYIVVPVGGLLIGLVDTHVDFIQHTVRFLRHHAATGQAA